MKKFIDYLNENITPMEYRENPVIVSIYKHLEYKHKELTRFPYNVQFMDNNGEHSFSHLSELCWLRITFYPQDRGLLGKKIDCYMTWKYHDNRFVYPIHIDYEEYYSSKMMFAANYEYKTTFEEDNPYKATEWIAQLLLNKEPYDQKGYDELVEEEAKHLPQQRLIDVALFFGKYKFMSEDIMKKIIKKYIPHDLNFAATQKIYTDIESIYKEKNKEIPEDILLLLVQSNPLVLTKLDKLNIPLKVQMAAIIRDPEIIHRIPYPDIKVMEYMLDNYRWIITDKDVIYWPEHLKKRWIRIGKARKQIGL